jgi:hypothetical protein
MIKDRMEGVGHKQHRKCVGKKFHAERLKQKADSQNHEHQNDLVYRFHQPFSFHHIQDPTSLSTPVQALYETILPLRL